MAAKPLSEGEIRFRVSANDRKSLAWLMKYHPTEPRTISELLRNLIAREHDALVNLTTISTKDD